MRVIPPPKPSKMSTTSDLSTTLLALADWVDYYRGAVNTYARASGNLCDPLVPEVRRTLLTDSLGRLSANPIFDMFLLWISCCRVYEFYRIGMQMDDAAIRNDTREFHELPGPMKSLIAMLAARSQRILEEAMQTPERREQQQAAAGLDIDTYSVNDWLNFLFEHSESDTFLAGF